MCTGTLFANSQGAPCCVRPFALPPPLAGRSPAKLGWESSTYFTGGITAWRPDLREGACENAALSCRAAARLRDSFAQGRASNTSRGLHSSIFWLNVITVCGIGGALRACLGGIRR